MARDVDLDDERWEASDDHPLFGAEATVQLEDREVTGRVRDVWKFRGDARTRRPRGPRQRRDRQHRPQSAGVLNFQSKLSARGFKAGAGVSAGKAGQDDSTHPRLVGQSSRRRDTVVRAPFFSAGWLKRFPEQTHRSGSRRRPWRTGLTQYAMTLRSSTRTTTRRKVRRDTTAESDEEESRNRSLCIREEMGSTKEIASRERECGSFVLVPSRVSSFIITPHWYHRNTNQPTNRQEMVSQRYHSLSSRGGLA